MQTRWRLRTRITLLVAAALFVTMSLIVGIAEFRGQLLNENLRAELLQNQRDLFQRVINDQIAALNKETTVIFQNRSLLTAISERNQAGIDELANIVYAKLSARKLITSLRFYGLDGTTLATIPHKDASSAPPALVTQAMTTKQSAGGVEQLSDGTAATIVAFPLFMRGQPIGIATYVQHLDTALASIKETTSAEVYALARDGTSAGGKPALFNQMDEPLPTLGKSAVRRIATSEGVITVLVQPIEDYGLRPIGHLVTVRPETHATASQRYESHSLLLIAFAVAAVVCGVLYLFVTKTLQPLSDAAEEITRAAHGDLTVKFTATGKDEVGAICNAVGSLVEQLSSYKAEATQNLSQSKYADSRPSGVAAEVESTTK